MEESRHFVYLRMLIMRKILHSKDVWMPNAIQDNDLKPHFVRQLVAFYPEHPK